MKKIFTFAAALLASLSMMAEPTTVFHWRSSITGDVAPETTLTATGGSITVEKKTGGTKSLGNESAAYVANTPDDMKIEGSKALKIGTSDAWLKVSVTNNIKEGDTLFLCGYQQVWVSSTRTEGEKPTSHDIADITLGSDKNNHECKYVVVPADIDVTEFFIARNSSSCVLSAIKIVRPDGYTPVTKYTVTYMDGETVLGTEKVEEGNAPANHANFETKFHATFDAWYNDAELTDAADLTAAINADKTFYGKWTEAEDIELASVSDSTCWDFSKVSIAASAPTEIKGDNGIKLTTETTPSITDMIVYANATYLNYTSAFDGTSIAFAGQYPTRSNQFCQNGTLKINITKNGKLKVDFSDTGSSVSATAEARYLCINGVKTEFSTCRPTSGSTKSNDRKEVTVDVTTGEVLINAVKADGETATAINVYKVTYVPSATPTSINNAEAAKAIKVIENGQIVIIKNGVRYNAVGAKL